MRIAHFTGEGQGWNAGVTEYVVFIDDPEEDINGHVAPGFELSGVVEVDDDPAFNSFPLNSTLVPKN